MTEVQQREIVRVILHCCGNVGHPRCCNMPARLTKQFIQEKAYNPYYTLVGQRLASQSHAHKITFQFCLWDFLRDLGETSVGGTELIKSLDPDGAFGGTNIGSVSASRRRNVARAYAWWLARGAVPLTLLKPVDFLALKPATRSFVRELLERALLNTQTPTPVLSARVRDLPPRRERGPIEEVFLKAARVPALAAGLVYFLEEMKKAREEDGNEKEEDGFYRWACDAAIDTLRMGVDVTEAF
jgi:nucleolar MIF4G domain-containing protein 1